MNHLNVIALSIILINFCESMPLVLYYKNSDYFPQKQLQNLSTNTNHFRNHKKVYKIVKPLSNIKFPTSTPNYNVHTLKKPTVTKPFVKSKNAKVHLKNPHKNFTNKPIVTINKVPYYLVPNKHQPKSQSPKVDESKIKLNIKQPSYGKTKPTVMQYQTKQAKALPSQISSSKVKLHAGAVLTRRHSSEELYDEEDVNKNVAKDSSPDITHSSDCNFVTLGAKAGPEGKI